MKIAIFTDTYHPQINGVVTSTETLAAQLEALGHQVLIVGPKMDWALESTDRVWRFRSVIFPFQPEYRMISPLSRKLKQFKALNFDIIHVQTPFFIGHLGQYLSWLYRLPLVHTYHTLWAEYLHYFPALPKQLRHQADMLLLTRNFCNRCDHVVVPSHQMKEKLIDCKVRVPLSVVPTGIDLKRIPFTDADLNNFRKQNGIKPNQKICIYVGRLGREKNVYFLLDSFQRVAEQDPYAVLLVIGDGPESEGMMLYAEKLGLSDRVIFTGYLPHPQIFLAYASSDVIMFASKTETQGLSLLEGLSQSKPAVCVDAMGVKDIFVGNQGGFLTEESVESHSNAVIQLLQNPKLYHQKQAEARAVAEHFSSDMMAKRMLQVYHEAIVLRRRFNRKRRITVARFFRGPFWKLFFRRD